MVRTVMIALIASNAKRSKPRMGRRCRIARRTSRMKARFPPPPPPRSGFKKELPSTLSPGLSSEPTLSISTKIDVITAIFV